MNLQAPFFIYSNLNVLNNSSYKSLPLISTNSTIDKYHNMWYFIVSDLNQIITQEDKYESSI